MNGVNQQGLVRFATKQLAPNNDAIQGYPEILPVATPLADGTVRLEWQAAWDRDNARITYEVLRGATVNTSTVLKTFTYDSNWWTRPPLGFVDTTAPPGTTQTYRIRVTSAFANGYVGPSATVSIPAGTAPTSAYRQSVLANGAFDHWRLGESSGTDRERLGQRGRPDAVDRSRARRPRARCSTRPTRPPAGRAPPAPPRSKARPRAG